LHRGVDVARAMGLRHVAGCTGTTSEAAVQRHFGLPLEAMLDMGDFAGGLLKYLRSHPVERVTIGGGFGKIAKLAQGALDLHSGRSQVDLAWIAARVPPGLRLRVEAANSALDALQICNEAGFDVAGVVAAAALAVVHDVLRGSAIRADVIIVDREGRIIAHAG
jgi:cobalt-precorrin-5B (C1)-methyltransferase